MKYLALLILSFLPDAAFSQWILLEESRVGAFVSRDTVLRLSPQWGLNQKLEFSTDAGLTWEPRPDLPPLRTWKIEDTVSGREYFNGLQFHSSNVIYLGTHAEGWKQSPYGRLFRSTDLGKTWSKFPESGAAAAIVDTAFANLELPTLGGIVIRTTNHILTSQDRGVTWNIVNWKETKCKPSSSWVPQSSPLLFFTPDTSYYYGIAVGFEQNRGYYDIPFSYFTTNGWQTCDAPGWDATDHLSGGNWLRRSTKSIGNNEVQYQIHHRTDMRSGTWSLAFSDTVDAAGRTTYNLIKYAGQWLMPWRDSLILRSKDEGRSWSVIEELHLPLPFAGLAISVDSSTLYAYGRDWYRLDLPLDVKSPPASLQEIQMWPNPAMSEISLRHSSHGMIPFTISDCLGRTALAGETDLTGKINIAALPPGAYYFACSKGVVKFIKW